MCAQAEVHSFCFFFLPPARVWTLHLPKQLRQTYFETGREIYFPSGAIRGGGGVEGEGGEISVDFAQQAARSPLVLAAGETPECQVDDV